MLYVSGKMNKFCLPYHTRIKYKTQIKAKQYNTQKTKFLWASNVNLDGEELDVSTLALNTKIWLFGIQYLQVIQIAADTGQTLPWKQGHKAYLFNALIKMVGL